MFISKVANWVNLPFKPIYDFYDYITDIAELEQAHVNERLFRSDTAG